MRINNKQELEEAYEYYHALIYTYIEDSIKAAYAFREAHTINS